MKIEKIKVVVEFIEPVLGTVSGNPELHREFIIERVIEDKGPRKEEAQKLKEEEVAMLTESELEQEVGKQQTVFSRDAGGLLLWDYQLRGFLKETLRTFIALGEVEISRWQYKRLVDSMVFVFPRKLYLRLPGEETIWQKAEKLHERSLRVDTMRGERVALASSEMLPPGTWFEAEIQVLSPEKKVKEALVSMKLVEELLDYGKLKGLGQWRGGSFGRITWKKLPA